MKIIGKKGLFLTLLMFLLISVQGQNIKKMQNLAGEYLRIEEYHHALPIYLKLDSLMPNDGAVNYAIGKCYMHSEHKTSAVPYFEKTLTLGGAPVDIYRDLAICYHLVHSFDKAIRFYNKALNRIPEEVEDVDAYKKHLTKNLESCHYAKTLVANPIDMEIVNVGEVINTDFPDFVPVVSADETTLIFTSRREGVVGGLIDDNDGLFFEDVYISKKVNGKWSTPKNMGPPINTPGHDASVGLSPDGQKLFIYRSHERATNGLLGGDLFVSDWDGEMWSEPVKMQDGINSRGREPSASITSDENTLFFSSNRQGGKGGLDIYWAKRLPSGEWAAPKPIKEINTEYDEDAPFIHSDGRTLYFSSRGHKTMGGYDIFRSIYNEQDETWSEPINMGYPINTAGDDIYFVWSADGKRGYFSSLREDSYGEKDIYVVNVPQDGSTFAVLKGKVLDKETNLPLIANIKVTDIATGKMAGFYTSSAEGRFTAIVPQKAKFALLTGTNGYLASYDSISIPEVKGYYEETITIYLEKGEDDVVVSLDTVKKEVIKEIEKPKPGTKFVFNNIYFDFDKASLRASSKVELEKINEILTKYPTLKVEIGAHTDAWGNNDYNMDLSGRRAKSVLDYLVGKGIARDRMIDKAYGETVPVGPSDNPVNNQKNRRIEFKVLAN